MQARVNSLMRHSLSKTVYKKANQTKETSSFNYQQGRPPCEVPEFALSLSHSLIFSHIEGKAAKISFIELSVILFKEDTDLAAELRIFSHSFSNLQHSYNGQQPNAEEKSIILKMDIVNHNQSGIRQE